MLLDGEKLSQINYKISIGRFSSLNDDAFGDALNNIEDSKGPSVGKIHILEKAFNVKVAYNKISKIDIGNPHFLQLFLSKLIFEPFCKIRYSINNTKKSYSFLNKGSIKGYGYIIIYANTGQILEEKFISKKDASRIAKISSKASNIRKTPLVENRSSTRTWGQSSDAYNNITENPILTKLFVKI